jgi:hypothetical protein
MSDYSRRYPDTEHLVAADSSERWLLLQAVVGVRIDVTSLQAATQAASQQTANDRLSQAESAAFGRACQTV